MDYAKEIPHNTTHNYLRNIQSLTLFKRTFFTKSVPLYIVLCYNVSCIIHINSGRSRYTFLYFVEPLIYCILYIART